MEVRRLAAIMFTDIVGYTALMGSDEKKAFELLRRNRKLQKSIIEKYNGQWLKEMGDGVLASFDTASDGVRCAGEIQNQAKKEDILLRIGIHEGEVVFESNDVLGDGVNVASRLEELAEVGSIYISGAVYKDIKNKEGISAEFVEEMILKNVDEPVKVYRVECEEVEVETFNSNNIERKSRKKFLYYLGGILVLVLVFIGYKFPKKQSVENIEKSIAVLPFRNDSPNNENVYFCNGIMEGILDHLSKISDLNVVSRTSVEQYRNNPPSLVEIAQKLGVNYILEGSVLRIGDQAKISAQLIYAPEDRHLWSKQFDKDLEDIFLVLSEVTQTIANDLKATISPELLDRIESIPTRSSKAYDYYLQGREYFNRYYQNGQINELTKSEKLYKLAMEIDSTFSLAYAGLAHVIWERDQFNFYKNQRSLDSVLMLCNQAIALDYASAEAYWVRGSFYDHIMIELDKAEADLKKAVELNPNHIQAIEHLAVFTAFHRRDYPSALKLAKRISEIDRSPRELTNNYTFIAYLYQSIGAWDKYLEYQKKAKEINPFLEDASIEYLQSKGFFREIIELINKQYDLNEQWVIYQLGLSYLLLKEYDKALEYFEKWEESIDLEGELSSSAVNGWHRYGQCLVALGKEKEGLQMIRNQLIKNDTIRNFQNTRYIYYDNAGICAFLGDRDRAFEYLRRFDESKHRWDYLVYFVEFDPLFDNIRNDPEFIKITEKVLEEHKRIRDEITRLESIGEI